ncbi:MAG: hypothetical protein ACOYOB_15920 [Myxococcota bacterium]
MGGTQRQSVVRVLVTALLVLAAMGLSLPAFAGPLDLHLEKFFAGTQTTALQAVRQEGYNSLMREIGLALGPRMLGPGASGGPLGYSATFESSWIGIHDKAEYWQKAADAPKSLVTSGQLRVRKGLPHQAQIGTVLTNLNDSDLWAFGAELGLSLIDGFKYIPDLGVRASLNTVLGNSDVDMFIVGADVAISKSFGIAGVMTLEPWLGYSMTYTYVGTHQLLTFADEHAVRPDVIVVEEFGSWGNVSEALGHRAAVGLRTVVMRAQLGAEFMRSFTDGLNVVTVKVGAEF